MADRQRERSTALRRRLVGSALAVLVAALVLDAPAKPARAAGEPVDLELVLAVDVSMSMDIDEQALQREGYVSAFRHGEVIDAILSGEHRRIAVTYVEWAGEAVQSVVVPWTVLASAADAHAFADRLGQAPMGRARRTSISSALDFSGRVFSQSATPGTRRVIDVSGDGPNNHGRLVTAARDETVAAGITINGLPLVLKKRNYYGYFDIEHLDAYYRDCVIGGPGAFSIPVLGVEEFVPAIRRKLVLEIAGREPPPRLIPAQFTPGQEAKSDCEVGEKMWRRWIEGQE